MELAEILQIELLLVAGVAGIAGAFAILRQQVIGLRRDLDRVEAQLNTHCDEGQEVRDNLTTLKVLVAEIRDDIRELKWQDTRNIGPSD